MERVAQCGLTIGEIGADTMEKFNACDESVTPDGGDSFHALKNRVLQARDTILADQKIRLLSSSKAIFFLLRIPHQLDLLPYP